MELGPVASVLMLADWANVAESRYEARQILAGVLYHRDIFDFPDTIHVVVPSYRLKSSLCERSLVPPAIPPV